jgi:WD40 repeat protein
MKHTILLSLTLVLAVNLLPIRAQVPWDIGIIHSEMIGTEPGFSYGFLPINEPNYFQVGRVSTKLPNGDREWKYKLLEYETMLVKDVIIAKNSFPETHMAILNMSKRTNGELLHYNGKVATVRFTQLKNYKNTGDYLCQFNCETGQWSDLVRVCNASDSLFFNPFGSDREDRYYYYALSERITEPPHIYNGDSHTIAKIDLVTLEIDTLLTLQMPNRKTNLHFQHSMISPDGRWLVLSEHWDKGYYHGDPKGAPPQAYIIDTRNNTFKTCLIPSAPYGHLFTPDSKYVIMGSYESGEIFKIDVDKGEQVSSVKGTTTIFDFHIAPSGKYFLVGYDEENCPRKVYDVRSTHDLKLITSVFLDELFPQPDLGRDLKSIFDGRVVISRSASPSDTVKLAGRILLHLLSDSIHPLDPGSPGAQKLALAETIANGKLYANRTHLELTPPRYIKGEARSVSIASDGNLIITGKRDVEHLTWALFISKITPEGEMIWETKLRGKKISDTSAGMHLPSPDGGCVVYSMYYSHERSIGQSRLSRISGTGKIIYDKLFVGRPNPNAIYIDPQEMEIQPDGSVILKGKKYLSEREHFSWTGLMSPEGEFTHQIVEQDR